MVDSGKGRGFVGGRGRCARIVGALTARAGGAMVAHGYLVGQWGGLDGILSLIKNIGEESGHVYGYGRWVRGKER